MLCSALVDISSKEADLSEEMKKLDGGHLAPQDTVTGTVSARCNRSSLLHLALLASHVQRISSPSGEQQECFDEPGIGASHGKYVDLTQSYCMPSHRSRAKQGKQKSAD